VGRQDNVDQIIARTEAHVLTALMISCVVVQMVGQAVDVKSQPQQQDQPQPNQKIIRLKQISGAMTVTANMKRLNKRKQSVRQTTTVWVSMMTCAMDQIWIPGVFGEVVIVFVQRDQDGNVTTMAASMTNRVQAHKLLQQSQAFAGQWIAKEGQRKTPTAFFHSRSGG